jgi:hypothetical protein
MVLKQPDRRYHRRHFPEPGLVGSERVTEMEFGFIISANPGQELFRVFDLFGFLHDPKRGDSVANQQSAHSYRDIRYVALDLARQGAPSIQRAVNSPGDARHRSWQLTSPIQNLV